MSGLEVVIPGWFATNLIGKVMEEARTYVRGNNEKDKRITSMLKRLEDVTLPDVEAVVAMAESEPMHIPQLETRQKKFREAWLELRDILQNLKQDKPKGKGIAGKVTSFIGNPISRKDRVKLEDALRKLETTGTFLALLEYSRKTKAQKDESRYKTRESTSILGGDKKVFGRDSERDAILDIILSSGDEAESSVMGKSKHRAGLGFIVLPIVGVGGVGKTTLAQVIYNFPRRNETDIQEQSPQKEQADRSIDKHFKVKMWVYVSEHFDEKKIMKEMLQQLTEEPTDGYSLNRLANKLAERLRNERFLLVLDDVWKVEKIQWKKLRSFITCGAPGSTVLVTTRDQEVADITRTADVEPIRLDALPPADFWELFQHCAFGNRNLAEDQRNRNLYIICWNIARKLPHLPLAGEAVGELLHSTKDDENEWKKIWDTAWWKLDGGSIFSCLKLSYDFLNTNLRHCFSYCSIFPPGYIFDRDRLVHMWMAQGFIPVDSKDNEDDEKRPEKIGEDWFRQLTNRSFFQPLWNRSFVMHDLMRELAVRVSENECLMLDDVTRQIPPTIRHLSLMIHNQHILEDTTNLGNVVGDLRRQHIHEDTTNLGDVLGGMRKVMKSLLTLSLFGDGYSEEFVKELKSMFKNFEGLRVLDLSCSNINIKVLPDAIGSLSFLRYMDISFTRVQQLPDTIGSLSHLQTMDLRGCGFQKLPGGMNRLISLRHLYAYGETLSLIRGIGKLTGLQELDQFSIGTEKGYRIEELEGMGELRGKLQISNLENVRNYDEAAKAKLSRKRHLDSLELVWDPLGRNDWPDHVEILGGLRPHRQLKQLTIRGYGDVRFPAWIGSSDVDFPNLERLVISDCHKLESLPPFGNLPNLKVLHISDVRSFSSFNDMHCSHNHWIYPSLEVLILEWTRFEEWPEIEGVRAFPCLRKLHIIHCSRLNIFPLRDLLHWQRLEELLIRSSGYLDLGSDLTPLEGLSSLSFLEISDCRKEISLSLGSLQELHLSDCPKLRISSGWQRLSSLKKLVINECPLLMMAPQPGQERCRARAFTSLVLLVIDDMALFFLRDIIHLDGDFPALKILQISNLSSSEVGGQWPAPFTSLRELRLKNCECLDLPSLSRFPLLNKLILDGCWIDSLLELPPLLQDLYIRRCPRLSRRYWKVGGEHWPEISRIPYINIDGQTIQWLREEVWEAAPPGPSQAGPSQPPSL